MVSVSVLLFLLSGCAFTTPIEELTPAVAGDSVSTSIGPLYILDVVIITTGEGEARVASLILRLDNEGPTPQNLGIRYETRSGLTSQQVEVPGDGVVTRGTRPGEPQLLLTDLKERPGRLLHMTFDVRGQVSSLEVPILNGAQPQYATLTPTPAPDATVPMGG